MKENSCCSTVLPTFGVVSVLILAILIGGYWHLVVLIYIFLMTYDMKHFHMLTCHLYIFSGEVPVKIFGSFINWVVCFLTVEF